MLTWDTLLYFAVALAVSISGAWLTIYFYEHSDHSVGRTVLKVGFGIAVLWTLIRLSV